MFVGLHVQIKQILSITLVFFLVCISMQVRSQTAPSGRYPVVADTGKWHPEEIQILWPQSKLIFNLPCEDERSGVANLLFQSKDTGEIFLIDTIQDSERYFNYHLFSGKYNAILLYNNGKYIKCDDVFFEKGTTKEVNMGNLIIQPADSESSRWLALRSFNLAIVERQFLRNLRNDTIISKNKVRGYVFNGNNWKAFSRFIVMSKNNDDRKSHGNIDHSDGYFELHIDDDIIQIIKLFGFVPSEIVIRSNSGVIIVMDDIKNHPDYTPSDRPILELKIPQ
ncbi:MAG: hypothetical protein LBL33_08485 [Tannerella sp.]|nr:hypothetical protein [Tannerella sp.]